MHELSTKELVSQAREQGRDLGLWRHGYGYPKYAKQVFGDIDLFGKKMLEIGCGNGIYSLWASLHGAEHVIGLEPLLDGSFDTPECYRNFSKMVGRLGLQGVEMRPLRLQDFEMGERYFDLILSVASINHLDEPSCVRLLKDPSAQQMYSSFFAKIGKMMKVGGKLIIMDCSSRNLFADLNLRNPFNPSIEWFKHHPPDLWAQMLSENGFVDIKISWTSGALLRYLGIYSIPWPLSYLFASVFRLETTYAGT